MFHPMSKKAFSLAMVATLSLGVLAGCGSAGTQKETQPGGGAAPANDQLSGTVTASGSTALQPLVQQAAKEFMEKHPNVQIQVSGGGSGTGLKNVAEGTSDIGNSDVKAGDEFKDKNLKEHIVAIAPFALIVNKDVNVDNLTKQQAADILTGKITNWKEVGGKDQKIVVVTRPDSSGSRKLVKQIVLDGKDITKDAVVQESSGAMVTAVSTTAGAIGYVDTAYVKDGVKALKFDGVEYSKENIKNGKYKLYGEERMYTKGEPKGAVKAFLDYILSDEFQNKRVEELKFLPASLLKQ
ncbi:phosphate ABC transporter substrate-binding protein [Effusibacillus pohliae]|uniref:phosphate ABC transporter substrate-binding protein n=1 Tax=Effusibacillus pohliae TaxID=232270 RepID=UPI00036348E9|nr:phosphate ABC transporter substrate-binding protein [Effusibacillus pohliae]